MTKKLEQSICFMNTVDYGLHKCDLGVVPSMDVRLMIEAVTLMLNPKDVKHLDFITSERDYFFVESSKWKTDNCIELLRFLQWKLDIANDDACLQWVSTEYICMRTMQCRQTVYKLKKKPYLKEGIHYKKLTPHKNSPIFWNFTKLRKAFKENEDYLQWY